MPSRKRWEVWIGDEGPYEALESTAQEAVRSAAEEWDAENDGALETSHREVRVRGSDGQRGRYRVWAVVRYEVEET